MSKHNFPIQILVENGGGVHYAARMRALSLLLAISAISEVSYATCEPWLSQPTLIQNLQRRDTNDHNPPTRSLKILTTGLHEHTDGTIDKIDPVVDAADPSAPFFLTLPNGRRVTRVYLSGLRYLEADSLDDILRGGTQTVRKIRSFYADGTEMVGSYQNDSFPWDPELHALPDGSLIGHGGVMPQRCAGQNPKCGPDNKARTRMWARVEFHETLPGVYEEQWHFQNSIFGHAPNFDDWVSEKHFHNYGATFFRLENGDYHRDAEDNLTMLFEAATEQNEASPFPWDTRLFGVKVAPDFRATLGAPVPLQGTRNRGGAPYMIARRYLGEQIAGHLVEGGRPVRVYENGRARWLVAFSAGDFVTTRYGIHLTVSENDDPLSRYQAVEDERGELIDFARTLRCVLDASWGPGRASLFYDERGELWMAFHFIQREDVLDGDLFEGWPRSHEEFSRRARRTAIAPIKIIFQNGQPHLRFDMTDADEQLKLKIRRCE